MKATITGSDSLSKRILVDLLGGLRVSEVPERYPVSLDQAKRLSRYRNMLELANDHLEFELYNRIQELGLRSLPLSYLFKKQDWTGIAEILSVVTDETTREELQLVIDGLGAKRKRILEFKENADLLLAQLENAEHRLRIKEKAILHIKNDMDEKIRIFNSYEEPYRSFLKEYLGLYEGDFVLAKRLNVNWQRILRKQEIIEYKADQYIYLIKDFAGFVESLKSRIRKGLDYRWNSEIDIERLRKTSSWIDVPDDGKYKIPSAFSGQFTDSIHKVNQELKEIQKEKVNIKKELFNLKNKTIHSYTEMTEASDFLSTFDLKRHKELQEKALKWLFQRGFIAVAEFTLPNGKRADIFAYNESQIVIFEVKVSQGDLVTDKKWTDYLPYCNEFYFLTSADLVNSVEEKIKDVNCGHYIETNGSLKLIKTDDRPVNKVDQEAELRFAAGQLLSRKFIYGY